MKRGFFKVLFMTMLLTVMFSGNVFAAEEQGTEDQVVVENLKDSVAVASVDSVNYEETVVATKTVQLSSSDSIYIEVHMYVDYGYDEGNFGWINDIYILNPQSFVGSNTVFIDTLTLVDASYTESTDYLKYRFNGSKTVGLNHYTYSGYIEIYTAVDEWGDISLSIVYTPISNN